MQERLSQPPVAEHAEVPKLKDWLQSHGIQAVLFDLDDTIIDTYTHERDAETRFVEHVVTLLPSLDTQELAQSFTTIHAAAFQTHSVSRERWDAVIAHLVETYGVATIPAFYAAKKELDHIYDTAPELLPGAMDTLVAFRGAVRKMGVVTHADPAWTDVKLDTRGLRTYFDSVTVADTHGSKGPEDWRRGIASLGVKPEHILVIGDNIIGDIQAAQKVGVKYTVVLPSPYEIYANGEIPDTAIRAQAIADVIPTLLKQPIRRPE